MHSPSPGLARMLILSSLLSATGMSVDAHSLDASRQPPENRSGYSDEQQWVVAEICQDIAEMACFARTPSNPPAVSISVSQEATTPTNPTYDVRIQGVGPEPRSFRVALQDYLWNPVNYTPLAVQLLGAQKPEERPAKSIGSNEIAKALLDLRGPVIQTENEKVSCLLEASLLDPDAHDAAALVVGALALREEAGDFSDARALLCRMAAHLAVANAARGGPPSDLHGALAEAILLTLAGKERAAIEKIGQIRLSNPDDATAQAWATALAMRSTHDWRLLKNPYGKSLIEQLEYYRARATSVGSGAAVKFLSQITPAPIPDWGCIVLGQPFFVSEGHLFSQTAIPLTMNEIAEVWQMAQGTPLEEQQLASRLNGWPQRCIANQGGRVGPRAISWDTWGSFYQRHLCHQIKNIVYFMRDMWGNEDAATGFIMAAEPEFSSLTFYPIVAHSYAFDDQSYSTAMKQACALCSTWPERVPFSAWRALRVIPANVSQPGTPPDANQWFKSGILFGTTFDVDARLSALGNARAHGAVQMVSLATPPALANAGPRGVGQLEALAAQAPSDYGILELLARRKCGDGCSYEELAEVLGPVADYNIAAMRALADKVKDRPQDYRRLCSRMGELVPEAFLELGKYLTEQDMPDEAAAAYEKAVERADRVSVANNSRWLVDYYFQRGRTNDAARIADMAAQVYSYGGLDAKIHFLELVGQYDEAEETAQRIAERYGTKAALALVYGKHRDFRSADGRTFGEKYDALLTSVFPSGLTKVTLQQLNTPPDPHLPPEFVEPPHRGAMFVSESKISKKWGIHQGDVIVALNGYRTDTVEQYDFVRGLSANDPKLDLVIWNGTYYSNIVAEVEGGLFGVELTDYAF